MVCVHLCLTVDCVDFLLCYCRCDVDLDGKNIGGWTPLMYAAYIGHDNIVNLLLETGVSVNVTTSKGLTPLMLVASCGNESIAYFLLQVRVFSNVFMFLSQCHAVQHRY